MRIDGRHWAAGLSAAVLVHIGVGGAILWQPPRSGAESAGVAGVEVSLGPSGAAPGSEARPVEEFDEVSQAAAAEASQASPDEVEVIDEVSQVDTPEDVETAHDTPPAEAVAVPPDTAVSEPVRPPEVDTAAPAETAIEDVPLEPAEAVEPETVEEEVEAVEAVPLIEETPAQKPEPSDTVAARAVEAPPLPTVKPPPEPQPQETEPDETEQVDEFAEEATAEAALDVALEDEPTTRDARSGTNGQGGSESGSNAGDADSTNGGGAPGVTNEYIAVLQAWLERHKRYPRHAQLRRQEGTALLYFVMDREGRVLDYRLEESSGHEILDGEVAAMIERAQPLPEMPEDVDRDRLELVVPVHFSLR